MRHLGEHFEKINPFEELKSTITISTLLRHPTARKEATVIEGGKVYQKGYSF